MPPFAPEVVQCESEFREGGEVTRRRYNSLAMHGVIDYHFDADDYPATAEYAARLERDAVDAPDTGFDPLEEQERDARARVQQPPEAIYAFRDDLHNPEFLRRITTDAVVPRRAPTEVLHEQAKAGVTAAVAGTAANLLRTNTLEAFTALPEYSLPDQMRQVRAREARAGQEANFRAILEQLENELFRIPAGVNDELRRKLEEERAMLQLDRPPGEQEAPAAPAAATTAKEPAEETLLTHEAARELFVLNPLELLPVEMRGNFMSLPEISAAWRLLYPYIIQTENRRTHVNAVELVRAMALCGAKFDGCIRLATRSRLGELLHSEYYASDLDTEGRLCGGHEHFDNERTTLVLFKFYVVRRTKDNVARLTRTMEEQNSAAVAKPATEARAANQAGSKFMNLNPRGLLDIDSQVGDAESDGTEEQGTQHSIRYLAREFLFCISVVCVEPPATDCVEGADFYPSDTDEPNSNSGDVSFFKRQRTDESSSSGDEEDEQQLVPTEMSEDVEVDGGGSDACFFVHSDDEEGEIALERYKRSTHESIPAPVLTVSKKTVEHCVGKWKSDVFSFQINSHVLKRLCIRSFRFYADANVERK